MKDVSELVATLDLPPLRLLPLQVTFQDSCHLCHGQGVVNQPRETVIVTANPGCLLQMRLGIERAGLAGRVEAVHVVDLLARALPE